MWKGTRRAAGHSRTEDLVHGQAFSPKLQRVAAKRELTNKYRAVKRQLDRIFAYRTEAVRRILLGERAASAA